MKPSSGDGRNYAPYCVRCLSEAAFGGHSEREDPLKAIPLILEGARETGLACTGCLTAAERQAAENAYWGDRR